MSGNGRLLFADVLTLMDQASKVLAELVMECDAVGLGGTSADAVKTHVAIALDALQAAQDLADHLL